MLPTPQPLTPPPPHPPHQPPTLQKQEHASLLGELLRVLEPRADHTRVVGLFRGAGQLALVKEYLQSAQKVSGGGAAGLGFVCVGG